MSGRKARRPANVNAQLAALYAQVPQIDCVGKCTDQCTEFPLPRVERRRIARATGVELNPDPPPAEYRGPRKTCPLLTDDGRCSAYDIRPLICRLWGAMEPPCVHGCRPVDGRPLLTYREAYALIGRAYEISGQDRLARQYDIADMISDEQATLMAPIMDAYVQGKIPREVAGLLGAALTEVHKERRQAT